MASGAWFSKEYDSFWVARTIRYLILLHKVMVALVVGRMGVIVIDGVLKR